MGQSQLKKKKVKTAPPDPMSIEPMAEYGENPIDEWTKEVHVLYGLNHQAVNHIMSMLDNTTYGKVFCLTNSTKELWKKLIKLSLGDQGKKKKVLLCNDSICLK